MTTLMLFKSAWFAALLLSFWGACGAKPAQANCLSAADLASLSNARFSAEDRILLKDICIQKYSLPLLQRPTNATAFLSRVTHHGVPANTSCEETSWCDRANVCTTVCKRGSLKVDPWLRHAIDFQWKLARRQPFCYAQLPGSHNSAISMADGYGNRDALFQTYLDSISFITRGGLLSTNNQWLSLTDQLALGVRNIELDTHWVAGELRIAHCGGLHLRRLNQLVRMFNLVARLLGHPVRWDTETMGCQPSLSSIPATDQRSLKDALQEVAEWLGRAGNEREFVTLFFDDQKDLHIWKKVGQLLTEVREVFGEGVVVTPPEWRGAMGGRWPSVEQLADAGKKVLLVSGTDYGEDMDPLIFARGGEVCGWFEPHLRNFVGPEQCAFQEGMRRHTGVGELSRVLSCELTYGPLNCDFIYGNDGLVLDKHSLPGVSACSVNTPAPDRLTPSRAATQIWSWAPGHPLAVPTIPPTPTTCAAIYATDGRWRVAPCSRHPRPTACRLVTSPPMPYPTHDEIASLLQQQKSGQASKAATSPKGLGAGGLGDVRLPWVVARGEYGKCPEGYTFEIPQTGRENVALVSMLKAVEVASAWLPLRGPRFEPEGWGAGVAAVQQQ